jgi:hypothetical protein
MVGITGSEGGDRPSLRVERHRRLDPDVAARLRCIYLEAFEPMKARSFTRIVMTDAEWEAIVADNDHTMKHVGWVDDVLGGVLIGTNRPDLIDWVSIEFLEARYPEALAAGELWYMMWVAVDPGLARSGLFRRLVDDFIAEIDWQVVIYDTCEANTFVTDVVTRAMAARGIDRSPDDRPIDVESYYAFTRPVPDRVV